MFTRDDDENVMNILVATDIHLGYMEKNGERGKDSFVSFEEIFMIAKERKVDFLLLGGDLFHENKPSRKTLHWTLELFRKYCLGDRACSVEVVSDQSVNFGHTSSSITCVNYENMNMNIGLPVFSIHGNHDDPSGAGELSAIDLLSVTGLLNHFGKQTSLEKIDISPVLLQKGTTKLALYGLGSIRDERLHRLFLKRLVTMLRPRVDKDEWFNMFVLHQNRAKHGPTNYIPEEFIDEFFDLVIWGHEHECLIEPEWNSIKNFFVMQPGSPVATSLSEGESKQKAVSLLQIRGREMKTEKIPLKTVRQMFFTTVTLADIISVRNKSADDLNAEVVSYCKDKVEEFLERAEEERSGHPKQPKKPLIRIRIDYSGGFEMFNAYRFGAKFTETVANPDNIVHFLKKSVKRENGMGGGDARDIDDMIGEEVVEKVKVEYFVEEYLNTKDKKDQLELLSVRGISQAVSEFVNKQEKEAIDVICNHQINKTKQHLKKREVELEKEEIIHEISSFHDEREEMRHDKTKQKDELSVLQEILERKRQESTIKGDRELSDEDIPNIKDDFPVTSSAKRGKAPPKSRGSRATRGGKGSRGGARGKRKASETSFQKGEDIMEAFKRQSQATNKPKTSPRFSPSGCEKFDSDFNDFTAVSAERVRDSSQLRKSSKISSQSAKRPHKGVTYISSDEEENPFGALSRSRKR